MPISSSVFITYRLYILLKSCIESKKRNANDSLFILHISDMKNSPAEFEVVFLRGNSDLGSIHTQAFDLEHFQC